MRELGSEFWDIPLTKEKHGSLFGCEAKWYLSGRSALMAVLDDICKDSAIKTAGLPSWCCDSMIKPFLSHGLKVEFYPVFLADGQLIQQPEAVKCDVILIMDYFGFRNFPDFCTDSTVIRDVTHSVFSETEYDCDYVFGSLRKWTGFYTGGFAISKNGHLAESPLIDDNLKYYLLRNRAMMMKAAYIKSSVGEKSFLALFAEAEEWLDKNEVIYGSSERDISVVERLDIQFIRKQRRANAEYLLSRLNGYSFVKCIGEMECPLFVPIFIDNSKRNDLRKYLIKNAIYCPVHWGVSEFHELTDLTRKIYDTELSIICDQRYDLSDMERIADTIENYMR